MTIPPENHFNYKTSTLERIRHSLLNTENTRLYHKRYALINLNVCKYNYNTKENAFKIFKVQHKNKLFCAEKQHAYVGADTLIMVSHPLMQEQWNEFAEETDKFEEESKIITHYLRTVFNKINCIEDLYRLISSSLHEHLPVRLKTTGTLTDKEIEKIKKELEPMQDVVEQRILLNLLQK